MSEANKALAARMPLEVFGQGRTGVIDEVLAPDFIDHGTVPPGMPPGPDGVKAFVAVVRNAFPDLTITVDHAIAEGDFVALHITASATMKGEFAGMPPSGKHATWEAVHISRFENGRVAEHWVVQDQLGMLQQLGFIPTSPADPAG
jgi:predicted ester cyclase